MMKKKISKLQTVKNFMKEHYVDIIVTVLFVVCCAVMADVFNTYNDYSGQMRYIH